MQASVEVLADKGPSGFTVDEVAARAGCGKATIYRRWPSRANLLLDTAHRMGLEPDRVDTGSVRDDLVAPHEPAGHQAPGHAGRPHHAGGHRRGVRSTPRCGRCSCAFIRDRRQRPREVGSRGIERGELRPRHRRGAAARPPRRDRALLPGAGERRAADEEFVGRLLDVVLAAFT